MPWFFNGWRPRPKATAVADTSLHGVIPTAAFLARNGRRLDPQLRRYLESLLINPFTFFEVLATDPGTGLTLRDVMTRQEHVVTERGLSRGPQRGDLLFGQLANVDRLTMLEASNAFAIPPVEKALVIALRADISDEHGVITPKLLRDHGHQLLGVFHDIADRVLNPRMPALRNTDGEPISPRKVRFDLKIEPQAAYEAFKHLALDLTDEKLLDDAVRDAAGAIARVRFPWRKLGNRIHPEWDDTILGWIDIDGRLLTASANSMLRAAALRYQIESVLGAGVSHLVTEIESAEKTMSDLRDGRNPVNPTTPTQEELLQRTEVREKLAAMIAGHWERWVDQPPPAPGNHTLMDAVADPDGREIVESIIIAAERNKGVPTDSAVFRRVRARLGLAESV